jgi:membrane-associated phospholipid phosphatase
MNSAKVASIITHISNPAIVAAVTFLALLFAHNVMLPSFVGISLTFGTVVPLSIIYLLSKRGLISDFFVSEKEERARPFAGAVLSYLVGSLLFWLLGAPSIVTALMLCYAGNTILMMLITLRWKISVHASGIAGPTTALIENLGAWASILILLLIPVGWARMRLKAHTPAQILAGGFVTIAATWLQLKLYLAIL